MTLARALARALAAAALLSAAPAPGATVPEWVREAAALAASDTSRAAAVELLSEKRRTVADDGRTATVVHRRVVRVARAEARDEASDVVVYSSETDRVREARAWSVLPDGDVATWSAKDAVDRELRDVSLYTDIRVRSFDLSTEVPVGSVCAFEWVVEEKLNFHQDEWTFRYELPVRRSRLVLELPSGWEAESVPFDHGPIEPAREGNRWTWELRDLAAEPVDRDAPPAAYRGPRVGVSWRPGSADAEGAFRTWQEVSRWLARLADPQSVPDAALESRARELFGGAGDPFERARRIARFVQDIRYVSIETGIGRGSGYRPRPAGQVLARAYGDCKDKANLLRTMLRIAGVDAWLVGVYSGDRDRVREPWPTPQQFNHMILALRAPDTLSAPAMVRGTALGTLVFFDPTDPDTPLGLLPESLEGSLALLIAHEQGGLTRLPESPPAASLVEQEIEATLTPDGGLELRARRVASGRAAALARAYKRVLPGTDYRRTIEKRVASEVRGAEISRLEPRDEPLAGRFVLELDARAPRHVSSAGGLVAFHPPLLMDVEFALPSADRKLPLAQEGAAWHGVTRVRLGEGWHVDELPAPVTLATRYGRFEAKWEVRDGVLEGTHRCEIPRLDVPAAEVEPLRRFRLDLRKALRSAVVLSRET